MLAFLRVVSVMRKGVIVSPKLRCVFHFAVCEWCAFCFAHKQASETERENEKILSFTSFPLSVECSSLPLSSNNEECDVERERGALMCVCEGGERKREKEHKRGKIA